MHTVGTICAVVPVYNAGHTLRELTERLSAVLSVWDDYRIILVDDGSTNDSREMAKALARGGDRITAIILEGNWGQQSAILCGLRHSDADYLVIIDDDLEQRPEDIPRLWDALVSGYDVVYGVREGTGGKGLVRGLGSRLRDGLFRWIAPLPPGVRVSSFRILGRDLAAKVIKADTRFVYVSMEILRHTRRVGNIIIGEAPVAPSGYRMTRLMALLIKIFIYYGPFRWLGPLRRRGDCYQIKTIVQGGDRS